HARRLRGLRAHGGAGTAAPRPGAHRVREHHAARPSRTGGAQERRLETRKRTEVEGSSRQRCEVGGRVTEIQKHKDGRTVAIVGAGLVGAGWAVVYARAGLKVKVFDANPE